LARVNFIAGPTPAFVAREMAKDVAIAVLLPTA